MTKKMLEKVGGMLSRRTLLSRTADAIGALLIGVVAPTRHALAGAGSCCNLCKDEDVTGCTYGNCACQWCWTCPSAAQQKIDCEKWICYECFETLPPMPSGGNQCGPRNECSGSGTDCPYVKCSKKQHKMIPDCKPQ